MQQIMCTEVIITQLRTNSSVSPLIKLYYVQDNVCRLKETL